MHKKTNLFYAYLTYWEDDKVVVLLWMAYKLYGGLAWMQAVFYGVHASVIRIIANSFQTNNKINCKIEPSIYKQN